MLGLAPELIHCMKMVRRVINIRDDSVVFKGVTWMAMVRDVQQLGQGIVIAFRVVGVHDPTELRTRFEVTVVEKEESSTRRQWPAGVGMLEIAAQWLPMTSIVRLRSRAKPTFGNAQRKERSRKSNLTQHRAMQEERAKPVFTRSRMQCNWPIQSALCLIRDVARVTAARPIQKSTASRAKGV